MRPRGAQQISRAAELRESEELWIISENSSVILDSFMGLLVGEQTTVADTRVRYLGVSVHSAWYTKYIYIVSYYSVTCLIWIRVLFV